MATVLVTAGPTREHLDDVRFLSNGSTGRMGYAVAAAAMAQGHTVHLVSGPTELQPPVGVAMHPVVSALAMQEAVADLFACTDVVVGVAAVTDYRPAVRAKGKPPRGPEPITIELVPNPDILAGLGARKEQRVLVGFALQSAGSGDEEEMFERARAKLARKKLDLIVVNPISAIAAEESGVALLYADGRCRRLPRQSKRATANHLVEEAIAILEKVHR